MTQAISTTQTQAVGAASWTREQVNVIKETVAKGATDAQLFMFLELAARYGLDPFAKEIWCVNMGGGMTIMASRDGYLKAAQRDPDFDGLKSFVVREGDEFSIDPVQDTVHHRFGTKRGAILGAWAIAYHRKRRPVIVWAEFSEYNKGNQVWKQYPSAMIQKVAEVMALKRQFGINGLVTQEEIGTPDERPYSDGPTVDTTTGEVIKPTSQGPNPPASVLKPALTQAQLKRLFAIAKQHNVSNNDLKSLMRDKWGIESTSQLTREQYDELCDTLIPEAGSELEQGGLEEAPGVAVEAELVTEPDHK